MVGEKENSTQVICSSLGWLCWKDHEESKERKGKRGSFTMPVLNPC